MQFVLGRILSVVKALSIGQQNKVPFERNGKERVGLMAKRRSRDPRVSG